MSFDEQPDGDIHGECAAEIHRIEQQVAELVEALDALLETCELHGLHDDKTYQSSKAVWRKVKQP